jgi:hypothetical protein
MKAPTKTSSREGEHPHAPLRDVCGSSADVDVPNLAQRSRREPSCIASVVRWARRYARGETCLYVAQSAASRLWAHAEGSRQDGLAVATV